MNPINMPGFTAERSLCISGTQYSMTSNQYHQTDHLNSTQSFVQRTVVPQLPLKFRVCGECKPRDFRQAYMGVGLMDCYDMVCDLPPKPGGPPPCTYSNHGQDACYLGGRANP
jgi:hypothetical protein